ncbi:unnamed protein product [Peronospora destructor]|uniref:MABP domain-containing protein n=1 Tax=Peronospora destructor TaxID=86335 RepID=A0AAV0UAW4_9STRA|nr:unnamed protein product [Peronospora destructor]
MDITTTVDIVVVYQRQEFYASAHASFDRKSLSLDLLQCQLFSLVGVKPDEQILMCFDTGKVLYAPSKLDVVTVVVPTEARPRFFLFSSTDLTSSLSEIAEDWRQICTKSTFGDAAVVQPAFEKITPGDSKFSFICEPCARTCTTGFQPVSPMKWNALQLMASRFISDVVVVAGDVDVAAPSGFIKLPVDLNYSASGNYMYLCVQRGGPRALTQVHVLLEQRGAGDAMSPVNVQLKGNIEQLETLAITDIAIVVGDQPVPSPGYVKITRNLNEGAMGSLPVFLYYRLLPLGGFACDSGAEHSDFGECLFATRHLTRVKSILDFEEQRLTIAQAALAAERRRGDTAVMEEHYRQHQPGMLKRLQSGLQRAQSYESKKMQEEALKRIPVDTLHERARSNTSPMPLYQDELIKQLLRWFKREFFTWMNQPHCSVCKYEKTRSVRTEGPSTAEEITGQASRVEVYQCLACGAYTRFPRYNDPVKLLDTRTGRCGEWANCFTLCCRAMGFEARYVLDVTDHVWTEVYSEHCKRWLHCDSCEEQLDCPLTYEVGWGKKLSYIFSFGHDEVVDSARRYTLNWSEMLARRQDVSEKWLETTINQINCGLWKRQSAERVAILTERMTDERNELLYRRSARHIEVNGRVSGSAEWKNRRNEAGKQEKVPISTAKCFNPFCFTGRTQSNLTRVPPDVNERAAQAIQVASNLSSVRFSSEALMMLLCPLTRTELRNFLWKNQPLLYLPLQDIPSTCSDRGVPLLDVSGYDNHADNSQRCGLRKPFRIPNAEPANDDNNGAGSKRNDEAFGMQLLGGNFLSIAGQNLPPLTDVLLSFLVRFDRNKALKDKKDVTVRVLAGRIGYPDLTPTKFRIHWSNSERQFLCKLQIEETTETAICTTSLLAFGQYAHVAVLLGKNAIAMYLNGTEILVLGGACRAKKSGVTIEGPASTYPGVAAVVSHVAMIPAQSPEEAQTFCDGMKAFVSAPPLKAFGSDGERGGERCFEVAAGAQSGYRVARILMWGSDCFDGLQFAYDKTDNLNVAPATVCGLLVGNANAQRQASQPTAMLDLLPDEIVTRMSGRKGAWIDSITLHTNFGRSITCGGKGEGDFDVPTPADSEIRAISFKIGDHLTDASVFVLQAAPIKALESKLAQDLEKILPSGKNPNRQLAISAALRYLGNIAHDPKESKFQRIRASNKYFAANVGVLGSEVAKSFMIWCGFEETFDHEDLFFTFQPWQLQDKPSLQRIAAEAHKRMHFLQNVGAQ